MKKIIHVINLSAVGGISRLFVPYYQYAREKSAYQHHVFGVNDLDRIYAYTVPFRNIQRSLISNIAFMYHIVSRSSIIHFYNWLGGRKVCAYLNMLPHNNIIFHEHGEVWNIKDQDMSVFRKNAQRAQLLIANSHASKMMLHKRVGVQKEKIRVIYNGYLSDARSARQENKKVRIIGFVGRFESFKGIHILIEAAKLLSSRKDIQFKIAGDGAIDDCLRRMSEGCSNVEFVGRVNDPVSFISEVDLLVVPSIREPLGNVIIEAGFCKKPVIATEVDGIPEIIDHDISGVLLKPTRSLPIDRCKNMPHYVVEPSSATLTAPKEIDPHELADSIQHMLGSEELMKKYGDNLYATVKERFSLQSYFNQCEKVYEDIFRRKT